MNAVRNVAEASSIDCATSNPLRVVVAKVEGARSIIGVMDGASPRAIESEDDKRSRMSLLRELGYKR